MCWSFFTDVQGVKGSSLTLKPVQKESQHQQISCTHYDSCSIFEAKKFSSRLRQKQTVLAPITLFVIMFNTTPLQNVSLFLQPVTYKYVFTEYVFLNVLELCVTYAQFPNLPLGGTIRGQNTYLPPCHQRLSITTAFGGHLLTAAGWQVDSLVTTDCSSPWVNYICHASQHLPGEA